MARTSTAMPEAMLRIVDVLSDPGKAGRANEDRAGWNDCCAFVIDGATGLGDRQYIGNAGSDAAWLAERAKATFEAGIDPGCDLAKLMASFSTSAKSAFFEAAGADAPRYAWPSASFVMVAKHGAGWRFAGLGDCTLYWRTGNRNARIYSALPGYHGDEQKWARAYIAHTGGFGRTASFHDSSEALEGLRRKRERQNTTEAGVWTLGLVPEAAGHLLQVPLPLEGPVQGLLCSDGFADLVDLYAAWTPDTLLDAALENGLLPLLEDLRRFERDVDPDGLAYPRFKQSDDATALLFEIAG